MERFSEDQIREALEQNMGNQYRSWIWMKSQGHELSHRLFYDLVEIYNLKHMADSYDTLHAQLAYGKLMDKVEEGDLQAIQMVLKAKGKKANFIPDQTVVDYKHDLEMEKLNQGNEYNKELVEAFKAEKKQSPHQKALQGFADAE